MYTILCDKIILKVETKNKCLETISKHFESLFNDIPPYCFEFSNNKLSDCDNIIIIKYMSESGLKRKKYFIKNT